MGTMVYKSTIKDAVLNIVMPLNHPVKDTKSLKIRKKIMKSREFYSHLSDLAVGVATNKIFLDFH